jgi:hypothetical protein
MGYHCRRVDESMYIVKENRSYDSFTIRDNDLYLNLSLSHDEYRSPQLLREILEKRIAHKFKQAKQPQNKTIAEMDVKINVDASELMKHLKTPQKETINTMAKPAQQTAKVIFPLNGEMYELELIAYDFTQTVDIASGLTCHFEGDSLREPKPLKKEASAGRLTLEDGATYELYPVTEL